MAVNYFSIPLQDFGKEQSLRCDTQFSAFANRTNVSISYRLNQFCDIINSSNIDINGLDEIDYCEIGNVDSQGNSYPVSVSFNNPIGNEDLIKKINKGDIMLPRKGDILISKIRPYLNKNILIEEDNIYYTKAFITIRPKINSTIFFYLIQGKYYKYFNAYARCGKGYPTLKEEDLSNIQFPKNTIDKIVYKQNVIVERIKPLEEEIKQLKQSKEEHIKIINNVFGAYFGFNWEDCDNFGKGMTAGTQKYKTREKTTFANSLNIFANPLLRFSCRYSNPQTQKCTTLLLSHPTKKIKDITREEPHRGSTPIYDNNGKTKVIKTAHLRNEYVAPSEEYVSGNTLDKYERARVKKGDILIASTGSNSLGKIDLYLNEEDAFADSHITILRINDNYNKDFLVYFLRSLLGSFQFERDFTGCTNQTDIYPKDILNFDIPDISLTEQERIVKEIKTQLNKQEERNKQITNKQKQISQIVEDSLK